MPSTYKCATCKSAFTSKSLFRDHIRSHKRKSFYCHICQSHYTLTTIGKKNHIKVHKDEILKNSDNNNDFHLTKSFSGTDSSTDVAKEFIKVYKNRSLSYDPLDKETLLEIFQLVQAEALDTGRLKIQVAFKLVWGNDTDDEDIKYSYSRTSDFIWSGGRRDFSELMKSKMEPVRALIMDPDPEHGSGYIYLGTKEISLITAQLDPHKYGYQQDKNKTVTQLKNDGVNTSTLIFPNTTGSNCFSRCILIGLHQASNDNKLHPVLKRKLEDGKVDLSMYENLLTNLPPDTVTISDINLFVKSNPKLGVKIIQQEKLDESKRSSWFDIYISPNYKNSEIKMQLLSTPSNTEDQPFFHHLSYINNFSSLIRKTFGEGRAAKRDHKPM